MSATVALVMVDRHARRDPRLRRHPWTRRVALAAAIAACWSPGAVAGATSGGAPTGSSGGALAPTTNPSGAAAALKGRGMWIWYVSQSSAGSLSSIISTAHAYGLNTLMIKAGDGASEEAEGQQQEEGGEAQAPGEPLGRDAQDQDTRQAKQDGLRHDHLDRGAKATRGILPENRANRA